MFLLGASKNIGAKPLADAVTVVIEVIRVIMKREDLVTDPHSLRFPPCAGASERAGCHNALIAASHAVRGCFDQLDLDARSAVTSLSRYMMVRKGTSGACSHMPELDMIFTQAALQAGPDPTLRRRRHALAGGETRFAQSRTSTNLRDTNVIAALNAQSM